MNLGGVVIMVLVLVFAVLAFSYALMRTYTDKHESSWLTSGISCSAIAVTLLCVAIIPIDIYIVSSDLNADGTQSNPDLTARAAHGIQSLYYALYILLLIFAFVLLPFTYFYFEEDSEHSTVGTRTCSALKYTAGFVVFFVVLLAVGLVLKKGHQSDESDWRNRLTNDFTGAEAILSFCIGALACIGLCAYVVNAAYGLARMPLKLMSRAKITPPLSATLPTSSGSRTEDLELSLRRNQENLQYLNAQYDSGKAWTPADKKQKDDLLREQRRLQSLRQSKLRGGAVHRRNSGATDELTCWDRTWNFLIPVRFLFAIPLLLLSLLLIVSLTITVVDKLVHSTCGASCGYALGKAHIINPIDEALKGLSKAFPIDCIAFAGLILYVFLSCVSGLVGMGVRMGPIALYKIQKQRTLPNAFMLAAWLLQLMALVLNMEVLTIAPTYATFGEQFYMNTTSNERQACDTHLIGLYPDTCVQTQVGRFINTMAIQTPFITVILFFGNLVFLCFFFLFLAHGIFCADNSKKEEVDAFRKLDDLSD